MAVLCGSLSLHPVSLGALMHTAGYAALGLLDWNYVPFRVTDLRGALQGMRALGIRGLGVSMPYKVEVVSLCDALSEHARRIGAVNTLVQEGGRITGHNTDAIGAVRALEEVIPVDGRRIALLGAGGAARAVADGLVAAGARVVVANRTLLKARELVEALVAHHGAEAASLEPGGTFSELSSFDVLVNATSAGMQEYGAASPFAGARLPSALVVFDIVYKPVHTALYEQARRAGCRAVHGGRMLLHQAAEQFALYTGREAPLDAMAAALERALSA